MFATTPTAYLGQPLVSCGAAQSVVGHDRRYAFFLKKAFHRHHADGLFGLSIMNASIFFHEQLEFA